MSLPYQNCGAVLAILRSPCGTAISAASTRTRTQTRSPQAWVRTIASQSIRTQKIPTVSFGEEADKVLSKYIRKTPVTLPSDADDGVDLSHVKERRRKLSGKTSSTPEIDAVADQYEISDFVDRTAGTKAKRNEKPGEIHDALSEIDNSYNKKKAKPINSKPKTKKAIKSESEREADSVRAYARPLKDMEDWQVQKSALKDKFKEGWNPRKKLSPDAMEGIRGLNEQDPIKYSTPVLAEQFKVSAEAIRRILRSKWMAKAEPEKFDERRERWAKRHDRIWDEQAELGLRPQRVKDAEVEDPDKFDQERERRRILREI